MWEVWWKVCIFAAESPHMKNMQHASGHAGLHPRGREPIERSGAGLTTHAEPAQTQAGTATGRGSDVDNDY